MNVWFLKLTKIGAFDYHKESVQTLHAFNEENKQKWAGWSKIAPMLITASNMVQYVVPEKFSCSFQFQQYVVFVER